MFDKLRVALDAPVRAELENLYPGDDGLAARSDEAPPELDDGPELLGAGLCRETKPGATKVALVARGNAGLDLTVSLRATAAADTHAIRPPQRDDPLAPPRCVCLVPERNELFDELAQLRYRKGPVHASHRKGGRAS